jgi:hypothetical protein
LVKVSFGRFSGAKKAEKGAGWVQDSVQDNQRKLPHFTGAVQDMQDKNGYL